MAKEQSTEDSTGHVNSHCGLAFISCKEYSKLASKKLDEPLTFLESIAYRFHKLVCMVCRRFERQISAIQCAASCYQKDSDQLEQDIHLTERAKARILDGIEQRAKEELEN